MNIVNSLVITENDIVINVNELTRALSVIKSVSGTSYYLHNVNGTLAIYTRFNDGDTKEAFLMYWNVRHVDDFGTHVDNLDEETRTLMNEFV